jgi:hypothetical protein
MSSPVLHRLFVQALSLAEQHLRSEARIVPMLAFAGSGGEAVLRLDLTPEAESPELRDKSQLMATALAAEACVWVFESQLLSPGAEPRRIVALLGEDETGAAMQLAAVSDQDLAPFESPLAAEAFGDRPSPLLHFIRRDPGENDPLEAWRRLEAMGVNRSDSRRPLH